MRSQNDNNIRDAIQIDIQNALWKARQTGDDLLVYLCEMTLEHLKEQRAAQRPAAQ